ncbi:MAG: biotin--[acetyl-CoA-carboxylase] ligase, partial [Novosphingobium sp.]
RVGDTVSPSSSAEPRPMIRVVEETGSTNADLAALGLAAAEGEWLVARRQRAGRGRAGRTWSDGAGNFMGSTAAHLRAGDPTAHTLALVAGLAAAQATADVAALGGMLALKWPNDLLLGGAKLGGILLERQGDTIVVGIGVNLAAAPDVPGRATTSLAIHGLVVPVERFAEVLHARWSQALAGWHRGEWPRLRREWLALAHPHGTRLGVKAADDTQLVGTFAGLAEDGAAHLRLADGTVHVIHAGDVELVGGEQVSHAAGG